MTPNDGSRTGVTFNESEVLRAFDPAAGCITNFTGATVKLWYNDEHVLTLGVHDVLIKEFHCGDTSGGVLRGHEPSQVQPSDADGSGGCGQRVERAQP